MVSIILFAIIIAIGVALLGSIALEYQGSVQKIILSPLEQSCQRIANEGYKIHTLYPNTNPEDLPETQMKLLYDLDEKWITQCVGVLSAESIINIVNNVERNTFSGEIIK